MKYLSSLVLALLLFGTNLFAEPTQIILGSFHQEEYAKNALVRINYFMKRDAKLRDLVARNNLSAKHKKMGPYHAIALEPFVSYRELLRTLKVLEKYYRDAYVIKIKSHSEPETKQELFEKIPQEVLEEEAQKEPATIEEIEKPTPTVAPTPLQTTTPKVTMQTKKEIQNESLIERYWLILLLIIVSLIAILMILKITNRRAKE